MDEQIWMLESMTWQANSADATGVNAETKWRNKNRVLFDEINADQDSLIYNLYPSIAGARQTAINYRQRLNHARIALRVDRHYQATAKVPKSLRMI